MAQDVLRPLERETEVQDLLSPLAACELFGKSDEAVRRAIREGLVKPPNAWQFGAKAVHLIDLESAIEYWVRGPRPAYMEQLNTALDRMRDCGVIYTDSSQLNWYRILHPFPLVFDPAKHPTEVDSP